MLIVRMHVIKYVFIWAIVLSSDFLRSMYRPESPWIEHHLIDNEWIHVNINNCHRLNVYLAPTLRHATLCRFCHFTHSCSMCFTCFCSFQLNSNAIQRFVRRDYRGFFIFLIVLNPNWVDWEEMWWNSKFTGYSSNFHWAFSSISFYLAWSSIKSCLIKGKIGEGTFSGYVIFKFVPAILRPSLHPEKYLPCVAPLLASTSYPSSCFT